MPASGSHNITSLSHSLTWRPKFDEKHPCSGFRVALKNHLVAQVNTQARLSPHSHLHLLHLLEDLALRQLDGQAVHPRVVELQLVVLHKGLDQGHVGPLFGRGSLAFPVTFESQRC